MMRRLLLPVFLLALCAAAAAQPAAAPQVGPAAPPPGVFSLRKSGNVLHLSLSGRHFTSRAALENYLAFRAAEATLDNRMQWFSFTERRARGDTVVTPKGDPAGPRFSFRMDYFRPQWRWRPAGAKGWQSWSPFSGAPFPDLAGAEYRLSADIVMHKGMVDDVNPLAFDAGAVSDYLINQVEAPR